jgi:AcrR family transcriptional regulator
MARTRQFDERQALVSAMLVFWEKGYEGTSIHDLEQAMGLTRTSIYNAFGCKQQLFNRILTCYKESVMAELIMKMDRAPTVREGISCLLNGALDIHFDEDNPGGCLVVQSVVDSSQHDIVSQGSPMQALQDMKALLQHRLSKGKKTGELPAELNVSSTAMTIATTMAGIMVMGKAHFSRPMLKKTINQVLQLLD